MTVKKVRKLRGCHERSGFSLIEMVMLLGVLLALTYLALPTSEVVTVKAREQLLREHLFEIRRAIDAYVAARASDGNSPYPPSLKSLTVPMTRPAKPGSGVNTGPFLAAESLGNPFTPSGNGFIWEIRLDGDSDFIRGITTDPAVELDPAHGVFDVRYPAAGVNGWKKAIDDSLYSEW